MPSEGAAGLPPAPPSVGRGADHAPPAAPLRLVRRPWLTAVLAVPIGFAYVVGTTAAIIAAAAVLMAGGGGTELSNISAAGVDADFVSIAAWAGTAVAVPLIVLVARLQALTTAGELLGWHAPAARQALAWLVVLLLFLVASDALTLLLGREIVPEVMVDLYASADVPVFFWLTLIVAAPLFEELLFRGLLFRALVETRLGFVGAALISSLCWSTLHVQYDGYGIASIFAGGLLLAAARYFTGSVLLCIGMHATMNLVATLEVLLLSGS